MLSYHCVCVMFAVLYLSYPIFPLIHLNYLSIYLSIYYLSVCPSIYLSVHLSIYPSIHLSMSLSPPLRSSVHVALRPVQERPAAADGMFGKGGSASHPYIPGITPGPDF